MIATKSRKCGLKRNSHPRVETPHGNRIVWRYMALDKFLDLLVGSRIHFANITTLSDQYEATLPSGNLFSHRKTLMAQGLSGDELEKEFKKYKRRLAADRFLTYVSTWSLGTSESYALWKIYLGGSTTGVAIRTTVGRLIRSIESEENGVSSEFFAGLVNYADSINAENPTMHEIITTKKTFYRYENELRLYFFDPGFGSTQVFPFANGKYVSVDLDQLIDTIYVSPFCASWFHDSLLQVVSTFYPSLKNKVWTSAVRDR